MESMFTSICGQHRRMYLASSEMCGNEYRCTVPLSRPTSSMLSEADTHLPMSKETHARQKRPTHVKRDLLQCQKRPTPMSKETYSYVKRDLRMSKEKSSNSMRSKADTTAWGPRRIHT